MRIIINDKTRINPSAKGWDIQKLNSKNEEWVSIRYYSNLSSAIKSAFERDLASYNKGTTIDNVDEFIKERIDKFLSKLEGVDL